MTNKRNRNKGKQPAQSRDIPLPVPQPSNEPAKTNPSPVPKKTFLDRVPLILSIIAIGLTWLNYQNTNTKWDALNLGNVILKEAHFIYYGEITAKQYDTTNWGYNVYATTVPGDYVMHSDKLLIPYCLSVFNKKTNVTTTDPRSTTISAMVEYLKKNNLFDTVNLLFSKHINVDLVMENFGGTKCTITNQTLKYYDPLLNKWVIIPMLNSKLPIEAKMQTSSGFEMDIPLDASLFIKFQFDITFTDTNNNAHTKNFNFQFNGKGWILIEVATA